MEADLRQVLIMGGAMSAVALVVLTGIAAVVRSDPVAAPAPEASVVPAAQPGATSRLAVAVLPKRARAERIARTPVESAETKMAPDGLRGGATPAGDASADAVTVTTPAPSLTPPPQPELTGPETDETPSLEEAPFLRGPAETDVEAAPSGPSPTTAPEARQEPTAPAVSGARRLAGRIIQPLRKLRPRLGGPREVPPAAGAAADVADAAARAGS